MVEKLGEKIRNIGLGMIEDEESGRKALGEFFVSIADDKSIRQPDGFAISLFNCLLEASDRLNDTVVPLFSMFVENEYNVEDFKSVILLFDENIDLAACKDLIFEAASENVSYDDFDEILKISSDQREFERLVKEKIKEITAAETEADEEDKTVPAEPITMDVEKDFISYLKNENERLTKHVDELKSNLLSCQSKEKESIEKNHAFKTQISDLKMEIERLTSELSKIKLSVVLIQGKYKKSQEMFEQEKMINAKLSDKTNVNLPDNEAMIKELQSENNNLRKSVSEIDRENVTLQSINNDLKGENERLLRELSNLKETNASLQDEIAGLRNRSIPSQNIPTFSLDDIPSKEDMSFPFLSKVPDDMPVNNQNVPVFSSDFTADLFNDDEPDDYTEADVITVENKKAAVLKSSNIFSKLLSKHFEKKFAKKPQAEQNNLIFMKLMEGNYSKDILKTVRQAIESNTSVSRIDLYKVISAKGDSNEILRLCKAA